MTQLYSLYSAWTDVQSSRVSGLIRREAYLRCPQAGRSNGALYYSGTRSDSQTCRVRRWECCCERYGVGRYWRYIFLRFERSFEAQIDDEFVMKFLFRRELYVVYLL